MFPIVLSRLLGDIFALYLLVGSPISSTDVGFHSSVGSSRKLAVFISPLEECGLSIKIPAST